MRRVVVAVLRMQPHLAAQPPLGVIPGLTRLLQPTVGRTATLLLSVAELVNQAHVIPLGKSRSVWVGCLAMRMGTCWPAATLARSSRHRCCWTVVLHRLTGLSCTFCDAALQDRLQRRLLPAHRAARFSR